MIRTFARRLRDAVPAMLELDCDPTRWSRLQWVLVYLAAMRAALEPIRNHDEERKASRVWGFAKEEHPERFHGAYASKAEAVREGLLTYIGTPFWIGCGTLADPIDYLPDVDDLIELMGERASDAAGEAADEFPDIGQDARSELEILLTGWARKHLRASFWVMEGNAEKVMP